MGPLGRHCGPGLRRCAGTPGTHGVRTAPFVAVPRPAIRQGIVVLGALGVAGASWAMASPDGVRALLAAAAAWFFLSLALRAPRAVLALLIVWLAALGLVRRVVSGVAAPSSVADPLLLVAPVVLATLAAIAITRGALRQRTWLTRSVLGLGAALALSALNPIQE